ncbi:MULTISPECIES: UV DNA damage repair endonuclease UvsE [Deinococcus]|uniref:UV DNA damage repair endonuclease UvsE n=1 Tax=Deinococcus rufus TaxID=2136097 RepID=A0ABV7ZH28_9DEIO|nr:UV DNA damage repair endonuclease UvsE [Deinococcus sp. AB2017081]WQE96937.1 UV DNA damage repair endonuclease UvsE [Deinococcus sp. AB2017081]
MTAAAPAWGLVCMTVGPELRFRTITRTRYEQLDPSAREAALHSIYAHNIARTGAAAGYCAGRGIGMYRLSSALFPMLDLQGDDTGAAVLDALAPELRAAGQGFLDAGIRVLMHPDQFIVLNSDSPGVRERSVQAMVAHARVMDGLGLERSPWNLLLLHGGKGGRGAELAAVIPDLPDGVRLRLALENDERAYGPADLLPVCEQAGVPLVFDAHHHVVHDALPDQEHPSVRQWVLAARATWTPPEWQVVHLSNGIDGPQDRRHSFLVAAVPSAYADVPWIEVEAKGKEEAIAALTAPV